MSRNVSKVFPVTKSCKVCKDAGLPERNYNNHNVKNEKGQVCCPTLKSVCCRNCDKMGHTEKYCKVTSTGGFKRIEVLERRAEHEEKEKVKVKSTAEKKTTNVFDSLMDSDSDDEPPANVTMRKPVAGLKMPEKTGFKISIPLSAWLATSPKTPRAKKTASIAPWAPMKKTSSIAPWALGKETSSIAPWALGKDSDKPAKKSWADLSDEDDEEDNTAW